MGVRRAAIVLPSGWGDVGLALRERGHIDTRLAFDPGTCHRVGRWASIPGDRPVWPRHGRLPRNPRLRDLRLRRSELASSGPAGCWRLRPPVPHPPAGFRGMGLLAPPSTHAMASGALLIRADLRDGPQI